MRRIGRQAPGGGVVGLAVPRHRAAIADGLDLALVDARVVRDHRDAVGERLLQRRPVGLPIGAVVEEHVDGPVEGRDARVVIRRRQEGDVRRAVGGDPRASLLTRRHDHVVEVRELGDEPSEAGQADRMEVRRPADPPTHDRLLGNAQPPAQRLARERGRRDGRVDDGVGASAQPRHVLAGRDRAVQDAAGVAGAEDVRLHVQRRQPLDQRPLVVARPRDVDDVEAERAGEPAEVARARPVAAPAAALAGGPGEGNDVVVADEPAHAIEAGVAIAGPVEHVRVEPASVERLQDALVAAPGAGEVDGATVIEDAERTVAAERDRRRRGAGGRPARPPRAG